MVQRAVDLGTAGEVLVATELARCGAASTLIERETGFGPRWVRRVVRENGGAYARKPRDPLLFFDQRPDRLLDACLFLGAHELQARKAATPGKRLLDGYRAYRRLSAGPASLDINDCAQIVYLFRAGEGRVRQCLECPEPYIVLSDHAQCPVCRLIAREFCRACGRPFEQRDHHFRAYCDDCSSRSGRSTGREGGGDTHERRVAASSFVSRPAGFSDASASAREGSSL